VVPDKQLSLAIGKEGQNARLAAKLTGWRIDIKPESMVERLAAPKVEAVVEERRPLQPWEEVIEREEVVAVEAPMAEAPAEAPFEAPAEEVAAPQPTARPVIRFAEEVLGERRRLEKEEVKAKRKKGRRPRPTDEEEELLEEWEEL
jgi:N utilization substance protein A